MNAFDPFWVTAAAMGLYMNTVGLLERIHKGQPTNLNSLIGAVLTWYVVFGIIVLCGD